MKQIKTLLIAAILVIGASQTINAQAKTAHVDVNDVMAKMPAMLDAQKQLEKLSTTYDADYKKMVEEYQGKLNGHLKADDFFGTAKFPTAKFEITACEAKADGDNTHLISGNLTIKDSTKNITFPAKVTVGETVTATGQVVINRLDWGINYDKENMTLAEAAQKKLKNGVVSKDITLTFNLTAKK